MRQARHWLVRPGTIGVLWRVLIVVLGLTLLANLPIYIHSNFGVDGSFGFYAWFGFAVCVAMVLVARLLGIFLKRPDDYYDD